jgi:hypothetical protein
MNIRRILAPAIASLAAGCVTTNLAPGAAQVNITRNAADVAACTAVGNIPQGLYSSDSAGNETVGRSGNTFFVTSENLTGAIFSGIAYSCPSK